MGHFGAVGAVSLREGWHVHRTSVRFARFLFSQNRCRPAASVTLPARLLFSHSKHIWLIFRQLHNRVSSLNDYFSLLFSTLPSLAPPPTLSSLRLHLCCSSARFACTICARFGKCMCTVRPYGLPGFCSLRTGVDLRRQSPFRRVSSFLIQNISG
jgi:hypothetical protein